MRRIKFLKSADGERIIRLRDVLSVRLEIIDNHGFIAGRIIAKLRGWADDVTIAGYAAVRDTPDAQILPIKARADMERLLHLLNGGRLAKGDIWPHE